MCNIASIADYVQVCPPKTVLLEPCRELHILFTHFCLAVLSVKYAVSTMMDDILQITDFPMQKNAINRNITLHVSERNTRWKKYNVTSVRFFYTNVRFLYIHTYKEGLLLYKFHICTSSLLDFICSIMGIRYIVFCICVCMIF